MSKDYSYELKSEKDNNVELEIKIVKERFQEKKNKAFKRMSKNIKISGFRPGKAPKAMIEARLGPDLFEQALQDLLPEITLAVIENAGFDPLTRIEYEVKKVSEEDGVEFNAKFTKYPEIKLADFKKIKVEKEKSEVTKEEIDSEVDRILKVYNQQQAEISKEDNKGLEPLAEGEEKKDEGKEEQKTEEVKEFTDEIVASLGLDLKTVEDLRKMIADQIEEQKQSRAESKKMQDIVAKAVELSKISAPASLVDQQVERKEQDYIARIEQIGLKLDDFLKTQKTSIEELRKTWKQESEEVIKSELLMYSIIKEQDLKIEAEEISKELASIQDPNLKKQYSSAEGQRYMANVILQQKALQWLQDEVDGKKSEKKEEKK